jgi:hypothetical protein
MIKEICGVLVDPVCTRTLQFFSAVTAGEQTDAKRARPSRRKHVPNAVADHRRNLYIRPEPIGSS